MAKFTKLSATQPGIGDTLGMPLIDDAQKEVAGSATVPMIGSGIGLTGDPEGSMGVASMLGSGADGGAVKPGSVTGELGIFPAAETYPSDLNG